MLKDLCAFVCVSASLLYWRAGEFDDQFIALMLLLPLNIINIIAAIVAFAFATSGAALAGAGGCFRFLFGRVGVCRAHKFSVHYVPLHSPFTFHSPS